MQLPFFSAKYPILFYSVCHPLIYHYPNPILINYLVMAMEVSEESVIKVTVDNTCSAITTKQQESHEEYHVHQNLKKTSDVDDDSEKELHGTPISSILIKLHAGYFRITLSLGTQALLWKVLSQNKNPPSALHHLLPSTTFLLLWWLALCTLILLSFLYILRCFFYFEMVKAEFSHHVGVNYLFTPWISWLLLLQSVPFLVPQTITYQILWWSFVIPMIFLDIKIYGQWFTTEKHFLSMVANPTSQMSVIGNLVAAWAAAQMGWKETAICTFTLGAAHYLVVFITLYQRLSGADRLPAMLRPVFFLFVAAPSAASLAWSSINNGTFDMSCKMLFYLSLFLFVSLVSKSPPQALFCSFLIYCCLGLFLRKIPKFMPCRSYSLRHYLAWLDLYYDFYG